MSGFRILALLPRTLSYKHGQRWCWLRQLSSGSGGDMFDKILVANRGEIACRVMRTAQRLGVKTVAVYSEADRKAMHVTMADEAFCIGPPPSSESYLRQDKIMEVTKATGAQGIHPGYGFLSENKIFAELCKSEGVEFIGPPPSAIEKMGTKRLSKSIMSSSGVPVVPGYIGDDQSDARLREEADKIGYPVMLKADLGGGGKGMRIVHTGEEFQQSLDACRSEATKSFGDDKVMVEKYVDRPRHVEVQVFGDKHGNTVHLYERDCSVQRRHQKIIEEAPAPGLRAEVRDKICSAAVRAAQAVGYVGAGTVEFIMDSNQEFFFMEMNTRLQVEHPITEMVTGTDLVEWQLRVAAGAPLPLDQSQLAPRGHAFEARIYAENPEMGFIPSPGILHHLAPPTSSPSIRIDTGVRQGDEVTTYYDPMIAKLVVWAENRSSSLKKLSDSLLHYQVAGVSTNIGFLERLSSHHGFQQGDVHTGYIEQHGSELFPSTPHLPLQHKQLAGLAVLALEKWNNSDKHCNQNDPFSPFNDGGGKWVNTQHTRRISLNHQEQTFHVDVLFKGDGTYDITTDCPSDSLAEGTTPHTAPASCHLTAEERDDDSTTLVLRTSIGNQQVSANIAIVDRQLHIFTREGSVLVSFPKPDFQEQREKREEGGIRSPKYPSTVTKVFVKPGDAVEKGMVLITVEGMKMETNILAAKDGVIKTVFYQEGTNVPAHSTVIEFEEDTDS